MVLERKIAGSGKRDGHVLVKRIDTVGRKEADWSERKMRELGENGRSSVQMSSGRLGEGKSVSM